MRRCAARSADLQQAETNAAWTESPSSRPRKGICRKARTSCSRLRELAVQAANGIYSDEDRMQIQVEVSPSGRRSRPDRFSRPVQRHEHAHRTIRPRDRRKHRHRFHVVPHWRQHGPAGTSLHRHHDRRGPWSQAAGQRAHHLRLHSRRANRPSACWMQLSKWSTSSGPTWVPIRTVWSTR